MSTEHFYTIPGQSHTKLLSRVWEHPGCIVDLGCAGWDWSAPFLGKKRVVGADPRAVHPGSFEKGLVDFWCGLVGPVEGEVEFESNDDRSTVFQTRNLRNTVQMLSWRSFCELSHVKQIAALKINIEGGEWPLLASMDADNFAAIDQIAVSFHDWRWPAMRKATEASLFMLHQLGFTGEQICKQYGWWLFTKK